MIVQEFDIKEITLPSKEEIEKMPGDVAMLLTNYWTRTQDESLEKIYVVSEGKILKSHIDDLYGIRPVIKISNLKCPNH